VPTADADVGNLPVEVRIELRTVSSRSTAWSEPSAPLRIAVTPRWSGSCFVGDLLIRVPVSERARTRASDLIHRRSRHRRTPATPRSDGWTRWSRTRGRSVILAITGQGGRLVRCAPPRLSGGSQGTMSTRRTWPRLRRGDTYPAIGRVRGCGRGRRDRSGTGIRSRSRRQAPVWRRALGFAIRIEVEASAGAGL
jgi:hypothetical protein